MNPNRTSMDLVAGQRVVVKVGSALLVDEANGTVHVPWLKSLAADLAACRARGQDVLVVSSGAIAVGRRQLALPAGALRLEEKQAAAATGMLRLAHAYQDVLAGFDISVALVLLTLDDTEDRRRYINARTTLTTLLKAGAIPLINENDTVATDEIRFGDNDRLAARVAAMVSADTLVLLSDVDGLYTADPRVDASAEFIPVVREITPQVERMAAKALPGDSTGGMVTKLAAAKIALAAGCRMVITRGQLDRPLTALENGARASWFLPAATPHAARKRWIGGNLKPAGVLTVDVGAAAALGHGKSLLPAGIVAVEGDFDKGAGVIVKDVDGREIGRGLCAYSAEDTRRIMGHKTGEIEAYLGYRGREEVIHADDLALHRKRMGPET